MGVLSIFLIELGELKMVNEQTVDKQASLQATTNLTPAQEVLQALWEEHLGYEFGTHRTEDAFATMVEDAYLNHIPVMTGGVGNQHCAIGRSDAGGRRSAGSCVVVACEAYMMCKCGRFVHRSNDASRSSLNAQSSLCRN
jgi:hypothetical protein